MLLGQSTAIIFPPFIIMEAAPLVPMLADMVNPLSGLAGAGFASAGAILFSVLCLVIGLPISFLIASFPLWISAKIAVSTETTYGTAIKTVICHFLAGLLIYAVAAALLFAVGAMGGVKGVIVILSLLSLISLFTMLMITGNAYEIGMLHAFGLHLLSFLMSLVISGIVFAGFALVLGTAGALAPLQASIQKIEEVGTTGKLPTFPSPSQSSDEPNLPPPGPDYSAEIDGLLNAALHPTGARPSLAEREDIVRALQQRLQSQRNSLQAGDARAASVYQNQLNRYLMLLEQVKAERKAHPLSDASAGPQAAR